MAKDDRNCDACLGTALWRVRLNCMCSSSWFEARDRSHLLACTKHIAHVTRCLTSSHHDPHVGMATAEVVISEIPARERTAPPRRSRRRSYA